MGAGTDHAKWLRSTLAAERDRLKLSYEQVARRVARELEVEHIPRQAIHKWEHFKTHPGIDQFAAWARALGLRLLVDLVREDEEGVNVFLPREVARVARLLTILSPEDLARVADLVHRLLPAGQKVSPHS